MKAKVKGKYEAYEGGAWAALSVNVGQELILKTTMTNATFAHGPSLAGMELALHKPNSFALQYNLPDKNIRFQFMNKVTLMDKTVHFTYSHAHGGNRAAVEGSVAFDHANKAWIGYDFWSGDWRVRYAYAHGLMGKTTVEPCYDVSKNAWGFSLSKRLDGGGSVKATYHTLSNDLGLEWKKRSNINGSFKVSAYLNLADECKVPKLKAESTWNYEI